jgi:cellulose synthase (UDP-forming)
MKIDLDKPGGVTQINIKREINLTYLAIIFALVGIIWFIIHTIQNHYPNYSFDIVIFSTIILLLAYGVFVYLLSRLGYLLRIKKYLPANDLELDESLLNPKKLTFLVPSYKEETRTIYQTLLSAAFQFYPNRKIVLLIDDPVNSKDEESKKMLLEARKVVSLVQSIFESQRIVIERIINSNKPNSVQEAYNSTIKWVKSIQSKQIIKDHTDELFNEVILSKIIVELCRYLDTKPEEKNSIARLRSLFDVELDYFERKQYINLSHEPNKAMNLNSYIQLMGANYNILKKEDGNYILASKNGKIKISNSDYIITLDADSLLICDYALRLVNYLEKKGNERVAVIQTPYSSIPGAQSSLERLAGATTDIQYIIHQGFTLFQATYWVGANAVLRKKALDSIVRWDKERGFKVARYVSDRTVIEDTESTIDLVDKGWTLHNYPRRLSYSATPPDYGSLLIQRRRWANGGLIILPKLLMHLAKQIHRPHYSIPAGFMRIHYLFSIAVVSMGTAILLFYPFKDTAMHLSIFFMAVSYYSIYSRDLTQIGYQARDIFRIYALNLLLLPINLGGVLKSIEQAILKKKIPFGRTPKVGGRTIAPKLYIALMFLIPLFLLFTLVFDLIEGNLLHTVFTSINIASFLYGLKLMGPIESFNELIFRPGYHQRTA